MKKLSIRKWQQAYEAGAFESPDRKTQINAGWHDWFCKDTSLANKTNKMGKIIEQVKEGGKIDIDNCYIWFKNSCPLNGPLFDELRISQIDNIEMKLSILFNCPISDYKFIVLGASNFFNEPIFECNNREELIRWINTPW